MSALERIKTASVSRPDKDSITRFHPFVTVTEEDRDALVRLIDGLVDRIFDLEKDVDEGRG